jgi:phosphoribosylamine--glycine ligase
MGAFSPSPLVNEALQQQIETTIVQPVLKGMAAEGNPYRGFLYCGLMLTPDGLKVIEFNVRFGDPEAQVVLPLLESLSTLLFEGPKPQAPSPKSPNVAVGVVLAARGYPGEVRTGDAIKGLNDVTRDCPDVQIFYAGVRRNVSDFVTSGGRVLTVMATAPSYQTAIERAYEAVSKIRFDGMQYRKDIGKKALLIP